MRNRIPLIYGVVGGLALCLILAEEGHAAAGPCAVPDARHPTIQSAANDPACGEIILGERIYSEQITLNRSGGISIRGVGAGRTVLASPLTRARSTLTTTFLPHYTYVVQVRAGTSATLSDLTIDGGNSARCGEPYFGIRFTGGSGELDRVVVENVKGSGTSFGCANVIAVGVTSESGAAAGSAALTLKGATVRSFQQVGVLANGPGSALSLSNTVLHGAGAQKQIVQVGVQLGGGATGQLDRPTVTDVQWSGDPCTGVGSAVKLAGAGTTSITGGFFLWDDRGVWLSKNSAGTITIDSNRFVETQGGVLSDGNGAGLVHIDKNAFINIKRSASSTDTCFADSGDAIAVTNEKSSVVSANSAAGSARCAIELLAGTSNLDVNGNQAVRSTRADIEDAGSANRLSKNLCTKSTPSGLCTGTP